MTILSSSKDAQVLWICRGFGSVRSASTLPLMFHHYEQGESRGAFDLERDPKFIIPLGSLRRPKGSPFSINRGVCLVSLHYGPVEPPALTLNDKYKKPSSYLDVSPRCHAMRLKSHAVPLHLIEAKSEDCELVRVLYDARKSAWPLSELQETSGWSDSHNMRPNMDVGTLSVSRSASLERDDTAQ
ncbi:hypothetical protein VNO77_03662 [Canavalia gladiata]|uniref:Uncharacterized protein n=1 Tax=Canavalia gladiata TaxID=3824 RepID=A0AAN9R715_CANGL